MCAIIERFSLFTVFALFCVTITRLKDPQRRPLVGRQRTKRNHLSTIKGPYQANAHSSYVELLLVADNSLFRKLDQDMWQVYHYCASLVNHINMVSMGLYQEINR